MRHRPLYTIILATIALLSSCVQREDGPAARIPISFKGEDEVWTRAPQDISEDYTIWVSSIYHGENDNRYYFHGQPFEWNGTSWTGNYYYPLSGTLDFVAFAATNTAHRAMASYVPAQNASLNANDTFTQMTLDFNGPRKLDGCDDVLVSDVIKGAGCGVNATSQKLTFNHLLACVRFEFTGTTLEAETYIRIKRVTLKNVRTSGKVSITLGDGAEIGGVANHSTVAGWESLTDVETYDRTGLILQPKFKPASPVAEVIMYLPPQCIDDIRADIVYQYMEEHNVLSAEMTLEDRVLSKTSHTYWKSGCRYTYSLEFTMLPHLELRAEFKDGNGTVLDDWVPETINL